MNWVRDRWMEGRDEQRERQESLRRDLERLPELTPMLDTDRDGNIVCLGWTSPIYTWDIKDIDGLSDLVVAINRLADEFHAYNQQHEPQKRQRGEAELFKADSEAESKREMHEELEALAADQDRSPRRRASQAR